MNKSTCQNCQKQIVTDVHLLLNHKYDANSLLYDKDVLKETISDYLNPFNDDASNLCLFCYFDKKSENDYQAMPPPKSKSK